MARKALIAAILFLAGGTPTFAEVNWSNTIAVIIGNADYGREDVPDLPFASNDVRAMEEFVRDGLEIPDRNIKVLRNAGKNDFQGVFGKGRWLDTEVQRTRANLLVYISSHGVPDKNQNAYFVPSNADPSFPEDLYPRTEVVAALERARKFQEGRDRRVIAIFDSCFSGGTANGALTPGKTGLPSMEIEQEDEDITVFSAVSSSGIAYPDEDAQLSALTSAFLQGWAGEADNPADGGNGDTQVSLIELSDYVQRSVPVLSKRNQQPDIRAGESFDITPFALTSLRPQLAAKEAQRKWEELDLSALNASVLGLGVDDLRPRRGYLRQINGEIRRLQGWCRQQPANACASFASNLRDLPEEVQNQRQRLEDQLAWKNAEDPTTFKIDCDAYKKACSRLQARRSGYSCLHEADLEWECPVDDAPLLETARVTGTIDAWRAYLEGCSNCADEDEAKQQISLLEAKARRAMLTSEDDAAWNKVRNSTTVSVIRARYLDKCNELCRHRKDAEAKIAEIERTEERRKQLALRQADERFWTITAKGSTTIAAYRTYLNGCNAICKYRDTANEKIAEIAKANIDAKKALRTADEKFWTRIAKGSDNPSSYRIYLNSCNEICAHKDEANRKLQEIETREAKKARLEAADFQAWLSVKFATSASIVRNRYLDQCNEICAYKTDAKKLINKLNSDEISRIDRLSKSNQVKLIQRFLNNVGCDAGTIDGVMGKGTERAFDRFVESNTYRTPNITDGNLRFILADVTVWNLGKYSRCDGETNSSSSTTKGQTFRDCPSCPLMAKIPAGTFMMGSNTEDNNAKPAHSVQIRKPFAIGVYEVTFGEWKACIDDGYCKSQVSPIGGNLDRPVTWVSWEDIQSPHRKGFISWLNSKVSGSPYRLPTEAEWEYAARAGSTAKWWWGYTLPKCNLGHSESAVFKSCGVGGSKKVGSYSSPNPFGLYDVHGNVSEWVQDCYVATYHNASKYETARSKSNCKLRVTRGGSWKDGYGAISSTARVSQNTKMRSNTIGFRVARDL